MKTLTWKVDKTIPTACPDYQPDPYTGQYPSFHCAVYHCKVVTEDMVKEFETEEQAKEFANKAPSSCYDFKLNGELLEDAREKPTDITYSTGGSLVGDGTTTITGTNSLSTVSIVDKSKQKGI